MDGRYRPVELYVPSALSDDDVKEHLRREITRIASDTGEFVHQIYVDGVEEHDEQWRKFSISYLPGPPAPLGPHDHCEVCAAAGVARVDAGDPDCIAAVIRQLLDLPAEPNPGEQVLLVRRPSADRPTVGHRRAPTRRRVPTGPRRVVHVICVLIAEDNG